LHFSSRYLQRQPIATVNFADSEIKTSVNARDLGVTLDQCLTMSTHVSNLCKSASFALKEISKIQRVQNSAARLVTKTRRADHITPILRKLHWMPVRKRFIFKILLFTYKISNGLAPFYLAKLINLRQPIRCLRSNNDHLRLHIPVFRRTKTCGGRAFSSCAPALWNSLPLDVRSAPSVDTFKT